MKIFKNLIFLMISTLVFNPAKAEIVTIQIKGVTSHESNCASLRFAPGNFNSSGMLVFDPSTPGGKAMLAISMQALAMGKSVIVNRITRGPGCWGIADQVTEVTLWP